MSLDPDDCRRFFEEAATYTDPVSDEVALTFERIWIGVGDQIRRTLDDDDLIVSALRRVARPYDGPPVPVWRGQSRADFDAGKLGISWALSREAASTYGRCHEWNRRGGMVILHAVAPATAVITVPRTGLGAAADALLAEILIDIKQLPDVHLVEEINDPPTPWERELAAFARPPL